MRIDPLMEAFHGLWAHPVRRLEDMWVSEDSTTLYILCKSVHTADRLYKFFEDKNISVFNHDDPCAGPMEGPDSTLGERVRGQQPSLLDEWVSRHAAA